MVLGTPPLIQQTQSVSEEYFLSRPIKITSPGSTLISDTVTPELVSSVKEDIWYINVCSDGKYDYRTVEIPFELADLLPNRNLSELEWRSVGITQSSGWENYYRSGFERNIFLFRKKMNICNDITEIQKYLSATRDRLTANPNGPISEMIIFPLAFWDQTLEETEIHTSRELLEYQERVLALSLERSN